MSEKIVCEEGIIKRRDIHELIIDFIDIGSLVSIYVNNNLLLNKCNDTAIVIFIFTAYADSCDNMVIKAENKSETINVVLKDIKCEDTKH